MYLIDGKGGFFEARIVDANPKKCKVEVIEEHENYSLKKFYNHIAIAPPKSIERFEWFLEKTTEIGIDEITPVITEHSERKIIKPERLERIIISAMKQSLKTVKPKLNPLIKFNEFIKKNYTANCFIAHCQTGQIPHLKNELKKMESNIILIGPEGDFSLKEIEIAKKHDFKEITLGNSRLRTETAGILACHIVNLVNN